MPRYFFNLIRKGKFISDHEGTELFDVDAAQKEAVSIARDMLISTLKTDEPVRLDDAVQVTNEHGARIHTVTLKEALGLP